MVLLFLLLWFIYIHAPYIEEDEGIEVAFGVTEQAGGSQPKETMAVPLIQAPAPLASSQPSASQKDLITQEDEESLQVARQQEEERKRQQELAEAQRQEQLKAEAEARAKAEAEAKAQAEKEAREAQAIANANKLGALFGNNNASAQGSGDTQGNGQKGNPVGKGSIGGNAWSLSGRDIKAMPKPANDFRQAGKVVVNIIVDANGKVVSAQVGKGTTISDDYTCQLAIKAAYKAEFSATDRPDKQMGTITYNFTYN